MILWKTLLSEAISAAAYGAIALALLGLFRARHAEILGGLRWVILGMAGLTAGLHLALGANAVWGRPGIAGDLALVKSVCQLVIAISLFPFLQAMQPRLMRALGQRGRARLERADRDAGEARSWLELAEAVANFGHWRVNLASQTLEWSDEMYRIHGVVPEQFTPTAETVLALFYKEDRKTVNASFAAAVATGKAFEAKVRLRRPDTELRHVILRGRLEGGTSVVGVLVDVTEQKVAEARMREANMVAIQANAALKEMTLEDALTGLSNRRQFDLSLVHEFKRAVRSNLPLGIVLIDLDHFQSYNEQYGQEAGDACLRRVAQAIKAIPRRTGDLVARHGGEEIVVLLPLADENGALRVATVIWEAVHGMHITHAGSESGFVTVSCGVAAFAGVADVNNPLELVRRADQALYKAKTDGRDRVVKYEIGLGGDLHEPYGPALGQDMDRFIKSRA